MLKNKKIYPFICGVLFYIIRIIISPIINPLLNIIYSFIQNGRIGSVIITLLVSLVCMIVVMIIHYIVLSKESININQIIKCSVTVAILRSIVVYFAFSILIRSNFAIQSIIYFIIDMIICSLVLSFLLPKQQSNHASNYEDIPLTSKQETTSILETSTSDSQNNNSNNRNTNDKVEEMKKLKTLLDQGVITQEEFEAKKKQLLGL